MPQLHIEESIVLYYPFPRYFWVPNSQRGNLLRKRLTEGLHKLFDNGTFDSLFNTYHASHIERLHLSDRRLFIIKNPFLPEKTPLDNKKYWYDPMAGK